MTQLSPAALTLLLALFLASCGGQSGGETVRVFAASSLQDVLPGVLQPFERAHPGVSLTFQFAGSQTLATQLEEGARADVFISANADQAERLLAAGRATDSATLIENALVIAVRADASVARIEDLGRPGVRIAIGAPDVPVGQLTRRVIDLLDAALAEAIRGNVVTEDPNVRIVLSRVELGEVDAAFVYRTDMVAARSARMLPLPADVEAPVNRYVIVGLAGAAPAARAVIEYLLGGEAQQAFAAGGFIPAADGTTAAAPGGATNGSR